MAAEEDIILSQFGKRVRELRRKKKLSQEDVGLEADLEQAYISDVELGRRNISLRNIQALAKTLGVTLAELFEGLE